MNLRPDLLALTPDDLAVLSNRGTVKRAQREVDTDEVSVEWETTEEGWIVAHWSDAVVCEIPAGKTLHEATCSCPAVELCRHLVRTVLGWQTRRKDAKEEKSSTTESIPPPNLWNPAVFTDAQMESVAAKGLLSKARQLWVQGALVECVMGAKPTARFYDLGLSVRFPVPGDIRYAHCDCGGPAPCVHAMLAVFAFRQMEPGKVAALVASGPGDQAQDEPLLADAEKVVMSLLNDGIAGISSNEADRWKRCASNLQSLGFTWLAGIVDDLLLERERYVTRDALFAPENLAMLAGELLMRCDALRHGGSLPRGLAGGWKTTEKTEVGYSRWIGLGTLVNVSSKSTKLSALMQEAATGSIGSVVREVANPTDSNAEAASFAELARIGMVKGAGIRALGGGQVLTEGCRRTPDNRLAFGRARAQVSTQSFEWEKLRAPVLVEDFAELQLRLSLLPPRSLRPRRDGEDFHVLQLARNSAPVWDHVTQSLSVDLFDDSGNKILLRVPWTSRSATGVDFLAAKVAENSIRFVSGQVALNSFGVTIVPAGVVLNGASRTLIQPWVDDANVADPADDTHVVGAKVMPENERFVATTWAQFGSLISDAMVTGIRSAGSAHREAWSNLAEDATAAGSHLAAQLATALGDAWRRQLEGRAVELVPLLSRALVAWRLSLDLA